MRSGHVFVDGLIAEKSINICMGGKKSESGIISRLSHNAVSRLSMVGCPCERDEISFAASSSHQTPTPVSLSTTGRRRRGFPERWRLVFRETNRYYCLTPVFSFLLADRYLPYERVTRAHVEFSNQHVLPRL